MRLKRFQSLCAFDFSYLSTALFIIATLVLIVLCFLLLAVSVDMVAMGRRLSLRLRVKTKI